jgi:hypothetical protein
LRPRPATALAAGPLALFILLAAAALAFGSGEAHADAGYPVAAQGYDISYPQCARSAFPTGAVGFAIVGVNGGQPMTKNPCFAAQIAWARKAANAPSLYVNTDAPPTAFTASQCGATDRSCRAYQYGRQAAQYSLNAAAANASDITRYWLDVETLNSWSTDTGENAAMLRGMIEVLSSAGKTVGIYSTRYQYTLIAGSYAPGLDNWVPRPEARHETAAAYCASSPSFGGGKVVMIQLWYTFDENYVCPPNSGNGGATTIPDPDAGDIVVVAVGSGCLNIRATTGTTATIATCVPDGTHLTVTGDVIVADGYNWVPVRATAGTSGWVASDYIQPLTAMPTDEAAQSPTPALSHRLTIANVSGD